MCVTSLGVQHDRQSGYMGSLNVCTARAMYEFASFIAHPMLSSRLGVDDPPIVGWPMVLVLDCLHSRTTYGFYCWGESTCTLLKYGRLYIYERRWPHPKLLGKCVLELASMSVHDFAYTAAKLWWHICQYFISECVLAQYALVEHCNMLLVMNYGITQNLQELFSDCLFYMGVNFSIIGHCGINFHANECLWIGHCT